MVHERRVAPSSAETHTDLFETQLLRTCTAEVRNRHPPAPAQLVSGDVQPAPRAVIESQQTSPADVAGLLVRTRVEPANSALPTFVHAC